MGQKKSSLACERCRLGKHKCDSKLPACSRCERLGVECLVRSNDLNKLVPRDYLIQLETKVLRYEIILKKLGVDPNLEPDYKEDVERQRSLGIRRLERPYNEPTTGGVKKNQANTLENQVSNALLRYTLFGYYDRRKPSYDAAPFLPSKYSAVILVDNYFRYAWIQLPIIKDRDCIDNLIQKLQENENLLTNFESHLLHMVFAIGSAVVGQNSKWLKGLAKPEEYYTQAMNKLNKCLPDLKEHRDTKLMLQSLLLISSFGLYKPVSPGIWYTINSAMRLAVELRLHREEHLAEVEKTVEGNDCFERRLFWSCYSLDRIINSYSGTPYSLVDGDITSQIRATTRSDSNHLKIFEAFFQARRLQSLIRTKLFDSSVQDDLEVWRAQTRVQIDDWHKNTTNELSVGNLLPLGNYLQLIYYQLIIDLHNPSSELSSVQLFGSFELTEIRYEVLNPQLVKHAALNIIQLYYELHEGGFLNYSHLSVCWILAAARLFVHLEVRSRSTQESLELTVQGLIRTAQLILQDLSNECPTAIQAWQVLNNIMVLEYS
ncbi:hypothetical protein KL925_004741 [Ogataea polymorpha]|nr:hypothetical protein KL925_004741 [Ogataea polymorpha]